MVMVLHDLNQACRYASHLIAVADGGIAASGSPSEVISPELTAQAVGKARPGVVLAGLGVRGRAPNPLSCCRSSERHTDGPPGAANRLPGRSLPERRRQTG